MKISAVLPLKTTGRHYADNIARCDILFSSLRAFTSPEIFDRFMIIVPHDEVEPTKKYAQAWSDFPVEVVDEAAHFGVFGKYMQRHQIRNWHRQQIIKLYTSELINTEYFLVFDPDTFATRPFDLETLLPGGRALTHMLPRDIDNVGYWLASAEVLKQKPNPAGDGIWMTPAILSRTLCRSLHKRLEELHGIPWMEVLLQRYAMDWTEYTLYWLNAEEQGLIDMFHAFPEPGAMALHTDESIWTAGSGGENLKRWDAQKYFAGDGKGIFAVIQSNTGLNVDEITKKLEPFMPIKRQPYDRQFSLKLKIAETYSAVVRQAMKKLSGN
jgi:hypothetical protein